MAADDGNAPPSPPPSQPRPPGPMLRRSLGSPALFAIVWTSLASSIYFSLGVVAGHALGLTPLVFLAAGVFFTLTSMTYAEGASQHRDRAGSTVFARHAFNELVSFVAGWAILLDYVILIAIASLTATSYLAAFYQPIGHGIPRLAVAVTIIGFVVLANIRGFSTRRTRRIAMVVVADLLIQLAVIVVGLVLYFNLSTITDNLHLGTAPTWPDVIFALTITTVAFTSLESAAGLSGEVTVGPRGLRRLVASANASVYIIYVGIAVVAVTAIPVIAGHTALATRHLGAPVLGLVETFHPRGLADALKYIVAAAAAVTLVAAANSAMLGLSRLTFSLATNRQIPSAIGRIHRTRSTPYVLIAVAGVLAAALVLPADLDFLVGIYAFGAMLAFTIAHLSICVLRFREPDRDRPYRVPGSIRVRGADLPIPAALGARRLGRGLGQRDRAARRRAVRRAGVDGRGSRAVRRLPQEPGKGPAREGHGPGVGAARGASGSATTDRFSCRCSGRRSTTTSSRRRPSWWPGRRPTRRRSTRRRSRRSGSSRSRCPSRSTPACPVEQLKAARAALARAKLVGEEYAGRRGRDGDDPRAADRTRDRRGGAAPRGRGDRARGRGGLPRSGAEPASAVGPGLGESAIGAMTRYVVAKAPCRVILTAPPISRPAEPSVVGSGADGVERRSRQGLTNIRRQCSY